MTKTRRKQTSAQALGPARALQALVETSFAGPRQRFELKRDGLSPCSFDGCLVASAGGRSSGERIAYRLDAYLKGDGGYVAAMTVGRSEGERTLHWARVFRTLDEIAAYFEAHDPARDVELAEDLTDARLPTAEAMIRAVALRQRIDEARHAYQAAAGDLLTELSSLGASPAVDHPQS
jgi:hypothetical protein